MLLIERLIAGQVVEHKKTEEFSNLTGSSVSGHLFQRLKDHQGRGSRKILRVRGVI